VVGRLAPLKICVYTGLLLSLSSGHGFCYAQGALAGLLVDQTRTRIGQEFYRQFCANWGEPRIDFLYNIAIKEMPDARWGSLITVRVNNRVAYRGSLRPRSSQVGEEVHKAIIQVKKYLLYLVRTNGNHDTPDLRGNGY
jgi:curli production assembly/transport component CsgE